MHTQKYAFDVEKACRSHRFEGRELWTLTVRARHLPLTFKLGPNARHATLTARPAKEMLKTLQEDPASFVFKNNGIMLVADSIRVDNDRVVIECKEPTDDEDFLGHGVLNGGHTFKVLTHALTCNDPKFKDVAEKAFVIITVGIGIAQEDIWRISRARNTSEKVPNFALRELAGDWSMLKKYLPPETRSLVAFKPNEPEAEDAEYTVTDLVKRLALIHNEMFPAQDNVHPVIAYTSIGTLVEKRYTPEGFKPVAHLLPDVLQLEEKIVKHWGDKSGKGPDKIGLYASAAFNREPMQLLTGYKADFTLADSFVLPVIAAFRVFIKDGKWAQPLDELWDKYGPRTVQALWDTYKEQGKSSAAMFGRQKTSWAATCQLTMMAAIQQGLIQVA